jgi:hypothetical protein
VTGVVMLESDPSRKLLKEGDLDEKICVEDKEVPQ